MKSHIPPYTYLCTARTILSHLHVLVFTLRQTDFLTLHTFTYILTQVFIVVDSNILAPRCNNSLKLKLAHLLHLASATLYQNRKLSIQPSKRCRMTKLQLKTEVLATIFNGKLFVYYLRFVLGNKNCNSSYLP